MCPKSSVPSKTPRSIRLASNCFASGRSCERRAREIGDSRVSDYKRQRESERTDVSMQLAELSQIVPDLGDKPHTDKIKILG